MLAKKAIEIVKAAHEKDERADLCRADLHEANLRGADLCRADLCEANLRGADLRGADLRGADLCRADLCEANLRGADLREANLRGANLCRADLCEANLCRADLHGADLRGADLDFSCWPLWCGSKDVVVDARLAAQLAAHFCAISCDDPAYQKARSDILEFALTSNRAGELGLTEVRRE
jgi:hypothetical protein